MRAYSDNWIAIVREAMEIDFEKNEAQAAVVNWWLESPSRFCLILGGERAGKSLLAAFLFLITMDLDKPGRYWVVGPDYLQARPEFEYIYNALNKGVGGLSFVKPESVSMPNNIASPWSFETIWGQIVQTKSASDIMKLASFSVSGIIMTEAAQHIYESWLKLMGRVSETHGFVILAGTLEQGLPWYADLYNRWQGENELDARSWSLPSWSNLEIYPGGYDDKAMKELRAEYPPDLFAERFAAVPMKKTGLVLPEYDVKRHVKKLEYDEKAPPVELWIDPGQHCYAVLFVQHSLGKHKLVTNILDRVYERDKIVHDIIPLAMSSRYWQYVDPRNGGVIDNAGKQHHANKSQIDLWQEIAGVSLRGHYVKLDVSIPTLRFRLGSGNIEHSPLVYFNSHMTNAKTPGGDALDVLAEPEMWSWPKRTPGRNQAMTPVDRNNDAMKALAYGLVDRYGGYEAKKVSTRGRRREYFI